MTKQEAEKQGLYFTGMWSWKTEELKRYANQIAGIKKKYKVRVVKVKDGDGWAYYGDDNFNLVHYDTAEKLQSIVDNNIPQRIEEAKRNYEKLLATIEQDKIKTLNKIQQIKAITK